MARVNRDKPLPDKKFVYIRSETYSLADEPFRRFEVSVDYSEADWKNLMAEAQSLGLEPERFFEQRLKRAIRPRASMSRVEHAKDRHKLYEGYSDFWQPFVKYLVFAHLTVILGGAIVELILGTGKSYIFFYWCYLGTLLFAIVAWLGYRLDYVLHRANYHNENDHTMKFELLIAKMSESLMWLSLWIFVLTILARISLGLYHAWNFLELPW